jgi:hypothetical protein
MKKKGDTVFKKNCKDCGSPLRFEKRNGRWNVTEVLSGGRHVCPEYQQRRAEVKQKTEEEMSKIYGIAEVRQTLDDLRETCETLGRAIEGVRLASLQTDKDQREFREMVLSQKKLLEVLNAAIPQT